MRNRANLIDDRPGEGVFRVHRDVFRDPAIFELEMDRFFERGWVFVGHESQIPQPHDFVTVQIGRSPVIISRDGQGHIHALHNSCRHKGAVVSPNLSGNKRVHLCPYHGWSYASDGRNLMVKDQAEGDYAPAFDQEDHDLQAVARFGNYRGFMFASLSADVPPLEAHLGDVRTLLDLAIDQAPDGLELVPGVVHYRFQANWKLQLENTIDAYHFASTHPSYLRLQERRASMPQRADAPKTIWQSANKPKEMMGSFGFPRGHAMVWTTTPVENHPLFEQRAQLHQRVGELRTQWMMRTRQLNVFPNLQIASSAAIQMRVIRPVAVDRTEITSYCLAPVGEDAQKRRQRLRQYEDFFNPSGLATPDDTAIYEDCQRGMASGAIEWQQGHARGMQRLVWGPDEHAQSLGLKPLTSVSGTFEMSDETVFHAMYRHWLEVMA